MQILRTRRQAAPDEEGKGSRMMSGGEEVVMMGGTVTQWEWGWGSGGGWLSGLDPLCCNTCTLNTLAAPALNMEALAADLDDEVDCELGDTDVGADFGDFGF